MAPNLFEDPASLASALELIKFILILPSPIVDNLFHTFLSVLKCKVNPDVFKLTISEYHDE